MCLNNENKANVMQAKLKKYSAGDSFSFSIRRTRPWFCAPGMDSIVRRTVFFSLVDLAREPSRKTSFFLSFHFLRPQSRK